VAEPEQYFAFRQIVSATGSPESAVRASWPLLATALEERGIYDRLVSIAAIATVRVETGVAFAPIPEFASGDDYEGRIDLGNTEPGDGRRYKGRGFIQITGRSNYTTYGRKLGLDLVNNPDGALDPTVAARILAVYFTDHRIRWLAEPHPLMSAADLARSEEWRGVRVAVNGGENGLDLFLRVVNTLEGIVQPTSVTYDKAYPVFAQNDPWSCGPTSLRWALHAIGRRPEESWIESTMLSEGVVSQADGILDATGAGIAAFVRRQYGEYGIDANHEPMISFDWAAAEGGHAYPFLIGGRAWGHWAAVRDYDPATGLLQLANPGDGWMGVGQTMSRQQFQALGPFSAVRVWHPDLIGETAPVIVPPNPDALLLAEVRADLRAILAKLDAAGV
jgi:hypothetical protein